MAGRMTEEEYRRITYRQRRLPCELARARTRVRHLEREAARLGMPELLEQHGLDTAEIAL